MRNSAKLSSGIAPLSQRCSSARISGIVVQGYSLAYNPVLHPVRDGRESSSIAIATEVADDSIASAVGFENGHVLTREALRLTGCVGVHSARVCTWKGS